MSAEPLDQPAFSNGFEWEHWSANWCHRCLNDANDDCPLILTALMGQTPLEWVQIEPTSLQDRYVCSDFRPLGGGSEEPSPSPTPAPVAAVGSSSPVGGEQR